MPKVYILYEDDCYDNEKTILRISLDLDNLQKIRDKLNEDYIKYSNLYLIYKKERDIFKAKNNEITHNFDQEFCNKYQLTWQMYNEVIASHSVIEYYIEEYELD